MKNSRKNQRRVIASVLTGMFVMQQTMTLSVFAGSITNGLGNNYTDPISNIRNHTSKEVGAFDGISKTEKFGGGYSYNIKAQHFNQSGTLGSRHYSDFTLNSKDNANLIYENNMTTFVNLVDSKININGIVNSVNKDGNYTAGKAIFISPNGFVLGPQGVMNVGELQVNAVGAAKIKDDKTGKILDDNSYYNQLVNAHNGFFRDDNTNGYYWAYDNNGNHLSLLDETGSTTYIYNTRVSEVGQTPLSIAKTQHTNVNEFQGTEQAGNIEIAGIILAKNINIAGKNVATDGANIIGGVKSGQVFNSLVQAKNVVDNKSFLIPEDGSGNIIIKSNASIVGDVRNLGTINSADYSQVNISNSKIENMANGKLKISNATLNDEVASGGVNITASEIINNGGNVDIYNHSGNLNIESGTINARDNITVSNNTNGLNAKNSSSTSSLNIGANAALTSTNGIINVANTGNAGMDVNGTLTANKGDVNIYNGYAILEDKNLGGTFQYGNSEVHDNAGMRVNATITAGKDVNVINDQYGVGGMTVDYNANITAENGTATYKNYAGQQKFNNAKSTSKDLVVYNEGNGGMLITGNNTNLTATNTAKYTNIKGALKVDTVAAMNSGTGLEITNEGEDGMDLAGNITNNSGTADIVNKNGDMAISGGIIDNKSGNMNIHNDAVNDSGLTIGGTIINKGGKLDINNKGKKGLKQTNAVSSKIMAEGLAITNEATGVDGMNLNGEIDNIGQGDYKNEAGDFTVGANAKITNDGTGNYTNNGNAFNINDGAQMWNKQNTASYTNNGIGGMNFNGAIDNTGTSIVNNKAGEMNIGGSFKNNGSTSMTNDGTTFNVTGTITNSNGTLAMLNNNGKLDIKSGAVVSNENGETTITNYGSNGLNIDGTVKGKKGSTKLTNNAGEFNIGEKGLVETEESELTMKNSGTGFNVRGKATGKNNNVNVENTNGELNIYETGLLETTTANNVKVTNTGDKVNVKGKIKSGKDVFVDTTNGDLVLGAETTDENIEAANDINIKATDASVLNYARNSKSPKLHRNDGAKTHLVAGGDLTMEVQNGTIGDNLDGTLADGNYSTTVSNNEGTRDFNKSVNANVKGKTKLTTTNKEYTNKANKPEDLVINYAAIDSDMNIDKINADGRVILTVDYDKDGNTYNMLNAASDNNSIANVEGYGISMISSGSIGNKDLANTVTFNQTNAGQLKGQYKNAKNYKENKHNLTKGYEMDVLANGDINMKAQSDDYTVNNVHSMASRHGSVNVEFAGNTYIEEVNAAKDINVTTRGKSLEIENLGTMPSLGDDKSKTSQYKDYLGDNQRKVDHPEASLTENQGWDDATPNNANLKALDINKTIRPDGSTTEPGYEGYYAYADSSVILHNGKVELEGGNTKDGGNVDIHADHVYANGIQAHFTEEFSKAVDDVYDTKQIEGTSKVPMGYAVTPDDVIAINHDEHERNYYQPKKQNIKPNPPEEPPIIKETPLKLDPVPDDLDIEGTIIDSAEERIKEIEPDLGDKNFTVDTSDIDNIGKIHDVDPKEPNIVPDDLDIEGTIIDTPEERIKEINPDLGDDNFKVDTSDIDNIGGIEDPTPVEPNIANDDLDIEGTIIDTGEERIQEIKPDLGEDNFEIDTSDIHQIDQIVDIEPVEPIITPDKPQPKDEEITDADYRLTYKKVVDNQVDTIDKRQYMRFNVNDTDKPVTMERNNNGIEHLIDVSRGGIAVRHDNSLNVGDVIPVHLTYGDLDIKADVKVVTATTNRAGAQFVNLDPATANKLLYLNIMLEDSFNNLSFNNN